LLFNRRLKSLISGQTDAAVFKAFFRPITIFNNRPRKLSREKIGRTRKISLDQLLTIIESLRPTTQHGSCCTDREQNVS
jgi:hypothetical protein